MFLRGRCRTFFWISLVLPVLFVVACRPVRSVVARGDAAVYSLENRMRCAVVQEPGSVAMLSLWVYTGCKSRQELNVAHLYEHLRLRELRRDDSSLLFHAETREDWQTFRCAFLPDRLALVLQEMVRLMDFSLPEEDEIVGARKEIELEMRSPVLQVSHLELKKFHDRCFLPGCMAILVISPLPVSQVVSRLQETFTSVCPVDCGCPSSVFPLDNFALALDGPFPALGDLFYLKIAPLYMKRFLAEDNSAWESAWQIRANRSSIYFRRQGQTSITNDRILIRAYQKTLLSPPKDKVFRELSEKILGAYYLAHDGIATKNDLLGKAVLQGYVRDVLCYPCLAKKAAPSRFYRWWKCYRVRNSAIGPISDHTTVSRVSLPDNFTCYPARAQKLKRLHLSLSSKTMAVLVTAHGQANATLAVLLPRNDPNAPGRAWLHHVLRNETKRFQGRMSFEDNPRYYIAATMVYRENFPAFLRQVAHRLARPKQRTGEISQDMKTQLWNSFCAKTDISFGREKMLLTLSGDFPQTFLRKHAENLRHALEALPSEHAPAVLNRQSDLRIYVMAAVYLPRQVNSFSAEMLSLSLAQAIRRELVIPGLAYYTGSHYQPMPGSGFLGVWVETTVKQTLQVQLGIQRAISDLIIPLTYDQWQSLREKTRVWRLLQRNSTLGRDYYYCRDLATGSLQADCGDYSQFVELQRKCFQSGKWRFVKTTGVFYRENF